jgi:hypothetical protein
MSNVEKLVNAAKGTDATSAAISCFLASERIRKAVLIVIVR